MTRAVFLTMSVLMLCSFNPLLHAQTPSPSVCRNGMVLAVRPGGIPSCVNPSEILPSNTPSPTASSVSSSTSPATSVAVQIGGARALESAQPSPSTVQAPVSVYSSSVQSNVAAMTGQLPPGQP